MTARPASGCHATELASAIALTSEMTGTYVATAPFSGSRQHAVGTVGRGLVVASMLHSPSPTGRAFSVAVGMATSGVWAGGTGLNPIPV